MSAQITNGPPGYCDVTGWSMRAPPLTHREAQMLATLRRLAVRLPASVIGSPWQEIERMRAEADAAARRAEGGL